MFSSSARYFFASMIVAIVFQPLLVLAQNNKPSSKPEFMMNKSEPRRGNTAIRVMFYNVENFFDVLDDSLTADDEYTPKGMRAWNNNRYQRKINNISKVVIRVGGWEPPELIGLCEVENRFVLANLVGFSPIKNFGYKVIHRDSPDPRGIDVGLLYLPDKFTPLETQYISIRFPFDQLARTRDILYVKGVVLKKDTIHLFVNHWPSRFGGYSATVPKRQYVASVLRQKVDSITQAQPEAKILIMGDFNDEPTDASITEVLKVKNDSLNLVKGDLYNMMTGAGCNWKRGTIKDKEVWICIDQFIVSASMLKNRYGLHTTPHSVKIMDAPFLLQNDDTWFGQKPFRTYFGAKYTGGFSDHLPIYLDIFVN
jgi:hypothetical protein